MKDIVIEELQPMFTTVVTTLDTYDEDLVLDGVIQSPKGTLKLYQKVIAVGPNVRDVKVGDLVLLNLTNYIKRKFRDDSIKADIEKMEDIPVIDFPKLLIGEKLYGKFQDRDIDGIITKHREVDIETNVTSNNLL